MSFGHCERYGWFKGFMDDVSKTNVILKNRVSVTILSIYIYILHEISGQIHLIKNVFPVLSLVTHVVHCKKSVLCYIIYSVNNFKKRCFRSKWCKLIMVITKLPNSEQSYKGKVKTHNYINRQNQSTAGKL